MVQRDVKYVPGFFKIIDEILVNAADNKVIVAASSLLELSDSLLRSMTQRWTL